MTRGWKIYNERISICPLEVGDNESKNMIEDLRRFLGESDNFVNFPNPKPKWDYFIPFLFCAGAVSLLLSFIVVAALIGAKIQF